MLSAENVSVTMEACNPVTGPQGLNDHSSQRPQIWMNGSIRATSKGGRPNLFKTKWT